MSCRVLQALNLIAPPADDSSLLHNDGSHGYFVLLVRPLSFPKGLFHPLFVLGHPAYVV